MRLARGLLMLSTALFAVTGLGYILAPGLMLSIVGIESATTADFLLRTEGVALLCAAGFIWAATTGRPRQMRIVLISLSVYYILGAALDLAAFAQGIVGSASVPSAAARIIVGCLCLVATWKLSDDRATAA